MLVAGLSRLFTTLGRNWEEARAGFPSDSTVPGGIYSFCFIRPSQLRASCAPPGFSSLCAEGESHGRDPHGVFPRRSSPPSPPPFYALLRERLRAAAVFHGLEPAEVAASLKSCVRGDRPRTAMQIHAVVVAAGLGRHTTVSNALMNFYCKICRFSEALQIFNAMSHRDVVSWNTVLSGFPCTKDALSFAVTMARSGVIFDAVTFTTALAYTSDLDDDDDGGGGGGGGSGFALQLHSQVVKAGFESDTFVGNALISAYAKAGLLEEADRVFGEMVERDLVSWNALISGYAQEEDRWARAMEVFVAMTREGLVVDHVSLSSALAACGHERNLRMGRQVHGMAMKSRLVKGASVSNVLMSMYAKCGSTDCARRVFQDVEERNVVSWTTMISIDAGEALALFKEMLLDGVEPNIVTFIALISAVAASGPSARSGEAIHGFCFKAGVRGSRNVCNSLVTMYAKWGSMEASRRVFDGMDSAEDAVSWNALISGYAQNGMCEEAMRAFSSMMMTSRCRPNDFTFGSVVSAVASAEETVCLTYGQRCHCLALKMGLDEGEHLTGALIDMYSKRGSVDGARRLFHQAPKKSLISWTAMISAEARHANYVGVVDLFEAMAANGVSPDQLTFLAVLTACGHGGMVDRGCQVFSSMVDDHGIEPNGEHYSAVVDMLGRAGRLEEAERLVGAIPGGAGLSAMQSLLGACRVHGDAAMAARAADALLGMGPTAESGTYVLLSNIYAEMGEWEKVAKVRKAMRDSGVRKEVGFSWVDCGGGGVHRFSSADKTHPRAEDVHWMSWFMGLQMRPLMDE
ncbi:unnamed protein product [Spirodela intermedia]|uniref:Uncharacterized protein n=1 Tax=Spirodela intermedia TaxID=51605 RepID=A0A7I8LKU8_SPIIN|nr:unnamed protein product [Spirodela intermedia]